MRRALTITVLSMTCALTGIGCVDRDPLTATNVPHVPHVPQVGSVPQLTQAEVDATQVAPERRHNAPRSLRLRETVSLGYAGDGPLTQISHGGELWYGNDGVARYGYGYGGYAWGYGGGYGARGARSAGVDTTQQGGAGAVGRGTVHPPIIGKGAGGRGPMGGWAGGRPSGSPRGLR